MRFLKPIVSIFMALLISVTSLGIAVSAHSCKSSGFSEAGLGHLKSCCKEVDGKGFQAEPCCKLSVKHVKLATVRIAVQSHDIDNGHFLLTVPAALSDISLPHFHLAGFDKWSRPPSPPPLRQRVDAQAFQAQFLI